MSSYLKFDFFPLANAVLVYFDGMVVLRSSKFLRLGTRKQRKLAFLLGFFCTCYLFCQLCKITQFLRARHKDVPFAIITDFIKLLTEARRPGYYYFYSGTRDYFIIFPKNKVQYVQVFLLFLYLKLMSLFHCNVKRKEKTVVLRVIQ